MIWHRPNLFRYHAILCSLPKWRTLHIIYLSASKFEKLQMRITHILARLNCAPCCATHIYADTHMITFSLRNSNYSEYLSAAAKKNLTGNLALFFGLYLGDIIWHRPAGVGRETKQKNTSASQ